VLQPLQRTFKPSDFPNLIVGLGEPDDAAVYQLNDTQAIVQTVDFFPPVVDDPYAFGAIAAANALSDIYAMGGEVLFALNLCAFPEDLPNDVISEILRGGAEKVAEAGAAIAGGHSVTDKEPKYGLSVTGIIDPKLVKAKGGAHVGDALVLTKPLGVGVVTTALKRDLAQSAHVADAIHSMTRLNKRAALAARKYGAHGMTDITGFGLLGHAREMAQQSRLTFTFEFEALPFLVGAMDYARDWIFPGGASANEQYVRPHTRFAGALSDWQQMLLFDPETSGGLLIALAADQADALVSDLRAQGESAWRVGDVGELNGAALVVT
jgi:selenide,water dikinase